MIDILKLTKNEVFKMFRKRLVVCFIGLSMLIIALFALYERDFDMEGISKYNLNKWEELVRQDTQLMVAILNDQSIQIADSVRTEYSNSVKVNQYLMDNKIPPIARNTASSVVLKSNKLFIVIIICAIVISCHFITSEYSNKTIGRLVSCGAKRWEILTAKFVAIMVFSVVIMLVFQVCTVICGWLVMGFDDFSNHYVYFDGSKVVERNVLAQMGLNLVYNSLSLIAISSLAVFIALLTRSNIWGIVTCGIISVVGYFLVTSLTEIDWLKYTLFANMDFSRYLNNQVAFANFTASSAALVLIVHTLVFAAGSYLIFSLRDVEA